MALEPLSVLGGDPQRHIVVQNRALGGGGCYLRAAGSVGQCDGEALVRLQFVVAAHQDGDRLDRLQRRVGRESQHTAGKRSAEIVGIGWVCSAAGNGIRNRQGFDGHPYAGDGKREFVVRARSTLELDRIGGRDCQQNVVVQDRSLRIRNHDLGAAGRIGQRDRETFVRFGVGVARDENLDRLDRLARRECQQPARQHTAKIVGVGRVGTAARDRVIDRDLVGQVSLAGNGERKGRRSGIALGFHGIGRRDQQVRIVVQNRPRGGFRVHRPVIVARQQGQHDGLVRFDQIIGNRLDRQRRNRLVRCKLNAARRRGKSRGAAYRVVHVEGGVTRHGELNSQRLIGDSDSRERVNQIRATVFEHCRRRDGDRDVGVIVQNRTGRRRGFRHGVFRARQQRQHDRLVVLDGLVGHRIDRDGCGRAACGESDGSRACVKTGCSRGRVIDAERRGAGDLEVDRQFAGCDAVAGKREDQRFAVVLRDARRCDHHAHFGIVVQNIAASGLLRHDGVRVRSHQVAQVDEKVLVGFHSQVPQHRDGDGLRQRLSRTEDQGAGDRLVVVVGHGGRAVAGGVVHGQFRGDRQTEADGKEQQLRARIAFQDRLRIFDEHARPIVVHNRSGCCAGFAHGVSNARHQGEYHRFVGLDHRIGDRMDDHFGRGAAGGKGHGPCCCRKTGGAGLRVVVAEGRSTSHGKGNGQRSGCHPRACERENQRFIGILQDGCGGNVQSDLRIVVADRAASRCRGDQCAVAGTRQRHVKVFVRFDQRVAADVDGQRFAGFVGGERDQSAGQRPAEIGRVGRSGAAARHRVIHGRRAGGQA